MHRMIIGHGSGDHNGRCNKIGVMKTGHIQTRTKGHIMAISLATEDYLRNEIWKVNKHHLDNKLNKLIGQFAKMHNSECLNKMEMEERDRAKVVQPVRFGHAEHNETP